MEPLSQELSHRKLPIMLVEGKTKAAVLKVGSVLPLGLHKVKIHFRIILRHYLPFHCVPWWTKLVP